MDSVGDLRRLLQRQLVEVHGGDGPDTFFKPAALPAMTTLSSDFAVPMSQN